MDSKDFFSAFSKVSKEAWKAKAIADLKGADFDKKLIWKTYDGIEVMPFYTKEDLDPTTDGQSSFVVDKKQNGWINYQEIDEGDEKAANQKATHAIAFDCNGLLFNVSEHVDISKLLKDIDPATTHISFKSDKPLKVMQRYFEYLNSNNISLSTIQGYCDYDVLGIWMTSDSSLDLDELVEIIKLTKETPGFFGLHIHSGDFTNAGATYTQELAFTLNKLVDYVDLLSENGLSISEVIANTSLDISLTGDFFFEIAKLRALKALLSGVLSTYDLSSMRIPIMGSNSIWSKSRYDYHVNMLRNTTEVMSAIIGGCDALLVQPHDRSYGTPSAFSHRVAVNISNLLREESYFDKVADPGSGSYYLEHITKELAEKSLELFQKTEAEGGLINQFKAGLIQDQIKNARDKKEQDLSTRKMVFVGTNKYPNSDEQMEEKLPEQVNQAKDGRILLVPQRGTQLFDELRQRTKALKKSKLGRLPKVYLSTFGDLKMRKARAGFAAEFFGIAGFEILGEFYQEDADERLEACTSSGADIIVLCSSDEEYGTEGVAFVKNLKRASNQQYLVIAGYPKDHVDELTEAGIDEFIHVKSDAILVLSGIQSKLLAPQS